jgi:N-acetylglucosamine transport system permease protein
VALGLFSMINGMQYSGDWSGLFASVIIVFLPTFILYLLLSKYIVGGLTGGVKG